MYESIGARSELQGDGLPGTDMHNTAFPMDILPQQHPHLTSQQERRSIYDDTLCQDWNLDGEESLNHSYLSMEDLIRS